MQDSLKRKRMITMCIFGERVVTGLRATVDYECCEEKLGMLHIHLNGIFIIPTYNCYDPVILLYGTVRTKAQPSGFLF